MGALFLVDDRNPRFADAAMEEARAQFSRHGLTRPTEVTLPGWRLLHASHVLGGPQTLLVDGDDVAAVAGTLTFDGKLGRPALEALLREGGFPSLDWSRLGGHFAALVRRAGRTFVFTDYFSAFQLFHDSEERIFSTSLLAAANTLPRLSFDPQGVYEFAFNVVPIGNATVLSELKTLGPERLVELTREGARTHRVEKPLPETPSEVRLEDRIERHRARLSEVVGAHVDHFGDRIHCPLSGGLDSRLLLAALRAEGSRPHVYVYGRRRSPDVEIAKQVGAAEGFEVDWIDKSAYRTIEPGAFAEQVERNFQEYDALPVDGELFESGANAAARDARHPGGGLAASGGCGEIFRNFFYLSARPRTAASLAKTFFARYDRGDTTAEFDEHQFLGALEDKILAALCRPGDRGKLPRPLLEQVYPRVRCRSFFGREISLEGRYGPYLMPFLDHGLVGEALTLPLDLKDAGRFEAMLLNAVDPSLARLPSAYGHSFAEPPGVRHELSEWSTRVRPAWLRQKSYALQRRLGRVPSGADPLLGEEYLRRVIDLDYPAMRRFFRIERIMDDALRRRVACLEYFAGRLGSRFA